VLALRCKSPLQSSLYARAAERQVQSKYHYGNRPFCVFETPVGDLGATYDDHLRLIGKGASQLVTRSTRHSPKSYDELTGS